MPCRPAADVCRFLQWESIAMISLFKSHSTKAAVVFIFFLNLFTLFVTNLMIAEMRNQPANSPNLNKITPTLDYNSGRWTEEESVYSHIFCHYSIDPFRLQQATCHLQIWVLPFLLRHRFKNHDFWSLSYSIHWFSSHFKGILVSGFRSKHMGKASWKFPSAEDKTQPQWLPLRYVVRQWVAHMNSFLSSGPLLLAFSTRF